MRAFWSMLILLSPWPAQAAGLQEAIAAYVEVLRLEEQYSEASAEEGQELTDALQSARSRLREIEKADKSDWNIWERETMARISSGRPGPRASDPKAIDFLTSTHPESRKISPLEWTAIRNWLGKATQEDLLVRAFGISELPATQLPAAKVRIVWVLDPFRRLLRAKGSPEKADLERLDLEVETVEISPFSRVEDQAEELRHYLNSRQRGPYLLASSGSASAVVLKLLDLHPSLRRSGKACAAG
jgi:hypothetical protein